MMNQNFLFDNYVAQFGEDVTIQGRTPLLDSNGNIIKNSDGSISYNEFSQTVRARIILNEGSEVSKMHWTGAYPTFEEANDKGLFRKSDAQYLQKGNIVILNRALTYKMEMLIPAEKKTHIEVTLKRNDE